MKIGWGIRVTILTLGFVVFMVFLVVSAFRQNFDLVTEDYYGKELQFEKQIEKQKNQQQLKDSLTCVVVGNHVVIKFPDDFVGQHVEGQILFFRPSDAKKDFAATIVAANNIQLFTKDLFTKGQYKIQIDYKAAGMKYYFEKNIMIN